MSETEYLIRYVWNFRGKWEDNFSAFFSHYTNYTSFCFFFSKIKIKNCSKKSKSLFWSEQERKHRQINDSSHDYLTFYRDLSILKSSLLLIYTQSSSPHNNSPLFKYTPPKANVPFHNSKSNSIQSAREKKKRRLINEPETSTPRQKNWKKSCFNFLSTFPRKTSATPCTTIWKKFHLKLQQSHFQA